MLLYAANGMRAGGALLGGSGMEQRIVRIGGASGFWGDSQFGPRQLVAGGGVDYLVFDYLAELTMSILAAARARSPDLGYAADFVTMLTPDLIQDIAAKRIKLLTNAGGLNPAACAAALRKAVAEAGVDLKVAHVEGDDVLALVGGGGHRWSPGDRSPDSFVSANAYLGGRPVATALDAGADIVVTGRCVDSALALGALVHEFGWSWNDFDRLAMGSLVGHLLECGAQATGGLHTDWETVERWEEIGYPIAECRADGSAVMTKPPGTGGLVNRAVICEQLLYEIGEPAAYALPDVICDFRSVTVAECGPHRVEVRGARGRAPTGDYKVSATFRDGYRVTLQLVIIGIDAAAKARRTADALFARVNAMLAAAGHTPFGETLVEVLGAESGYGPHGRASGAREVVLRIAARHSRKEPLQILARELAQAGTSWSPGTTGVGKRAEPVSVVRLHSAVIAAAAVPARTVFDEVSIAVAPPVASTKGEPEAAPDDPAPDDSSARGPQTSFPLVRLAYARSGDKGDVANIGVIARRPEFLPILRRELTAERVRTYFDHLVRGRVERFELPGIGAFNFVLDGALGGGGMASLRTDPLGKGMAQMLLDIDIPVPAALAALIGSSTRKEA